MKPKIKPLQIASQTKRVVLICTKYYTLIRTKFIHLFSKEKICHSEMKYSVFNGNSREKSFMVTNVLKRITKGKIDDFFWKIPTFFWKNATNFYATNFSKKSDELFGRMRRSYGKYRRILQKKRQIVEKLNLLKN